MSHCLPGLTQTWMDTAEPKRQSSAEGGSFPSQSLVFPTGCKFPVGLRPPQLCDGGRGHPPLSVQHLPEDRAGHVGAHPPPQQPSL